MYRVLEAGGPGRGLPPPDPAEETSWPCADLLYAAYERRLSRRLSGRHAPASRRRHAGRQPPLGQGPRGTAPRKATRPAPTTSPTSSTGARRPGRGRHPLAALDRQPHRPAAEVVPLLSIIETAVSDLAETQRWRINPVGSPDLLPAETARKLKESADAHRGRQRHDRQRRRRLRRPPGDHRRGALDARSPRRQRHDDRGAGRDACRSSTSPSTSTPRASPTPTSSSAPRGSSGSRASCSGRARTASSTSARPTGPTSGTSTSCAPCAPTPSATAASAASRTPAATIRLGGLGRTG